MKVLVTTSLILLIPLLCFAQDIAAPYPSSPAYRFVHLRPASFETADENDDTPPLNAWRVTGELATGAALGLTTGYIVALIGVAGGKGLSDSIERGYWGLALGHTLGSATGVYLIGTLGDETGSFAKTLLGSSLGMGTAFLVNAFVVESGPLFLALAPIGATLAFNLSRRYDDDATVGMGMALSLNNLRRVRVFVAGNRFQLAR